MPLPGVGSPEQAIHEGLNVVENWNSANGFIFYGKGGEIATNGLEDQEIAVLSLHLLLRHSCGFYLANQGYDLRLIQDYLGHRDPKHTVHYTRIAGLRFEGMWGA